jgi:hypothetical protein
VDAGADSTSTRRGPRTQSKVYRYIFSCMDVFSRKIWLEPMASKESAVSTTQALWRIIQRNDLDTPKSILVDRGLEFRGEFADYCRQNSITLRHTRAYTPNANPVERSNKAVRDVLQKLMVRNASLKWWDLLPQVEASRNSSYHSVLKASPDQVYAETVSLDAIVERNLKPASDKMEKYRSTEFQVDDKVFVSSSAIYSPTRDRYKAHQGKLIIVKFAPIICEIAKRIRPSATVVERPRYELKQAYFPYKTLSNVKNTEDGKKYTASRLYANELIECTLPTNQLSISVTEALRMNGVERRGTDLVFH